VKNVSLDNDTGDKKVSSKPEALPVMAELCEVSPTTTNKMHFVTECRSFPPHIHQTIPYQPLK